MHSYLHEIDDAIRKGGPIRGLLRDHTSHPEDFSAGLVAALLYPKQAHLGVNGTTFDAARPETAGVRYATIHFAERVRGTSLLDHIDNAHGSLATRPTCSIPRATELVGWIAANHPDNIEERRALYGSEPREESRKLAVELDRRFPKLTAGIGTAYVDGKELHPLEFVVVLTPNGAY